MIFYEKELMSIFGDSEVLSADTVSSGKMMISKIGKDIRAKSISRQQALPTITTR